MTSLGQFIVISCNKSAFSTPVGDDGVASVLLLRLVERGLRHGTLDHGYLHVASPRLEPRATFLWSFALYSSERRACVCAGTPRTACSSSVRTSTRMIGSALSSSALTSAADMSVTCSLNVGALH